MRKSNCKNIWLTSNIINRDPIANYASPAANINSISLLKGSSGALDVSIANILSAPIAASAREYQWNVPVTQETLVSCKLMIEFKLRNMRY